MNQFFYQIIYQKTVNKIIRNLNKIINPYILKKIKIPPSGLVKINVAGKKLELLTNQTSYITYLLFWEGFENFEYSTIFLNLIKKVDCFFDIGANFGYYSLLTSLTKPTCKVISFEPAIGPLFYFKENIKLNNIKNIKVESLAISHKSGNIDFYEAQNKKYKNLKYNLGGESNAGTKMQKGKFILNTVDTITLDEYCIKQNIKSIDLIKIDTEGTENLILQNANFVISKMRPIIICETLFNTIEGDLENIMKKYGYKFYNHTREGLIEVATLKRDFDNGIRNCFFVPQEKIEIIKEFVVNGI